MKAKVAAGLLAVSFWSGVAWAATPRPLAEIEGDGTLFFESGTGGGGARAVGDLVNFDVALQMGASYLRGMQADITEDNAGNGTNGVDENPDDPDDGGWDWRVTSPPAPFSHTTSASPTNIYGATVLGLYYAYLENADAATFTALQDAADYAVAAGPSVVRTASDMKFLMLFNDLYSSVVAPTTVYADAAKAKYDDRIIAYGGSATALAEFIRDVRGVTQGYPNGIIGWDVGKYAVAAQMLFDRYGAPYDADADAIAEVLWQDSFNSTPGLFDIVADAGWDPTYADRNFWWYTLGVTGLIDAFSASGSHTAEIPVLVTRLLDSQYTGGAISGSYGANAGDEDWQSTAYAMNSLGLLDQATYQLQINWMGYWTGATQDAPSGGWVYGSGNHYPEVVGECTRGLYFTSNTLTYVLVDDDFTSQADVDAYNTANGTSYVWGYDAFATIQNGIDAVNGSTVQVEPGTYVEQLYINKSLDLVGAGIGLTILQAVPVVDRTTYSITQWNGSVRTIDACIGVDGAGTVNISGFTVDGLDLGQNNFYGIHYFDTNGSVTDCRIEDVTWSASPGTQRVASLVATHGAAQTITIAFSNNVVPNFQKGGILIMGPGATFTVNGNSVTGVISPSIAGNCIQLSYGATGSTLNNVVQGTAYTGADWASTGILLFESGDIDMVGDEVFNCQSGVNFSDWGWVHLNPTPVNLTFTGLKLHDNEWTLGAQLSRDNSDLNMTVTDCDIVNSTGDGIDIWGSGPDPWGGSYYAGWSNGDLNVNITGSKISGAVLDGIWTADLSGNVNNVNSFGVTNTSFSGNTGSAINNTFPTQMVDASGCWWNNVAGPAQGIPLNRSQRPVAPRANPFGDDLPVDGTLPATESDVSAGGTGETIFGVVDYTPWMANDGTYNNPGFAGDFSTLWVDDDSPQAGSVLRVQEGVDMVTASTVNLAPGTYVGQVHITMDNLNLIGSGVDVSIIQSPVSLTEFFTTGANSNYPVIFVDGANGVSISDLTVDGDNQGDTNYRFSGLAFWNGGGSLTNGKVINIMNSTFSGAQHGIGIYAYNDTGGPHSITLNNVHVEDFQKNALALSGNGLTVDIDNLTAVGAGPTSVTAQNGIQIGFGAGGTVTDSSVSGIAYTGGSWTASGMLFYWATNIDVDGASSVSGSQSAIVFQGTNGSVDGATVTSGAVIDAEGVSVRDYGYTRAGASATAAGDVAPIEEDWTPGAGNGRGNPTSVTVRNSQFTGSFQTNSSGVSAWSIGDDVSVTIDDSTVVDWETGVVAYEDGSVVTVTAHTNTIAGNTDGFWANSAGVQDAELNWWGDVAGPADPGGVDEAGSPPCFDASTMKNDDATNGNATTDLNVDYCPWMSGPLCGNGVLDEGEFCDEGADNGTGEGFCINGCTAIQTCGDSDTNGTEECDDGNLDGNDCCSSTCQLDPLDTPCGTGPRECFDQDTCDGQGSCTTNVTEGADCGGPAGAPTQCSGQDSCDATGVCLPNHFDTSTTCGQGDTECSGQDNCDGQGSCSVLNHVPDGTSCGDVATECKDQDVCSNGTCQTAPFFNCGPTDGCCPPGCGPRDHDLDCGDPVPTVSAWGLMILALLLMVAGKVYFGRRRSAMTA